MAVTITIHVKHLFHCVCLIGWLMVLSYFATNGVQLLDLTTAFEKYGFYLTLFIVGIKLLAFLALPQTLFNMAGLLFYDTFQEGVTLHNSPLISPFLCVRVVTRGLYPGLVIDNVKKNMETLKTVGVENFIIQVVTDTSLNIASHFQFHGRPDPKVRELVVPTEYKSETGALNKSRALQYSLEDEQNFLDPEDWIIHLDEETLLTENSVRGILNFVTGNKGFSFGQGLITYAQSPATFRTWSKFIQNRICTVADSFRVSDDMGKLRCQFKIFHKAYFAWKGSYVVCKAGDERKISFDNGPEGSKAEDAFFAMVAHSRGYKFDFIEGEMWEKSPFTFKDFFQQRKRWMQGIFMVVASNRIPPKSKILLSMSLASWLALPLLTFGNLVFAQIYPLSLSPFLDGLLNMVGAVSLYMYAFGYVKQHPVNRYSWGRLVLVVPEIIFATLLSICVENLAVLTMWCGDWYDFYIVEKESDTLEGTKLEEVQIL